MQAIRIGGMILSQRWRGMSAYRAFEEIFIVNISVKVTGKCILYFYCDALFMALMPSRKIAMRWLTLALAFISSNLIPENFNVAALAAVNSAFACSIVIKLSAQHEENGACKSCHSPYSPQVVVPENINAPSFPARSAACT